MDNQPTGILDSNGSTPETAYTKDGFDTFFERIPPQVIKRLRGVIPRVTDFDLAILAEWNKSGASLKLGIVHEHLRGYIVDEVESRLSDDVVGEGIADWDVVTGYFDGLDFSLTAVTVEPVQLFDLAVDELLELINKSIADARG